jgi:hypothetical protein
MGERMAIGVGMLHWILLNQFGMGQAVRDRGQGRVAALDDAVRDAANHAVYCSGYLQAIA